MTYYIYNAADKCLWIEMDKPSDLTYQRAAMYTRSESPKEWGLIESYNSRLNYPCREDLQAQLKHNQRVREDEFELKYYELFVGNYVTPSAWLESNEESYKHLSPTRRNVVAIPKPEQKEERRFSLYDMKCVVSYLDEKYQKYFCEKFKIDLNK